MAYDFQIGSGSAMTNLANLPTPVPAPYWTYKDHSEELTLGNGSVRRVGYQLATWNWKILTKNQRDALKAIHTSGSGTAYIRTPIDNLTYDDFQAIMLWPEEENREAERALDLMLTFRLVTTI